jgi:lipopolysaccharide assembly protein A
MLIILLIVGSVLAYISQNNLTLVSVNIGPYVFSDIPLFYVIVGSLVTGLVLSYVIHLFRDISTSFVLRGKKNEIKKNKDEVLELTKRVHQLELENEKLKHSPVVEAEDRNAL